MTANDSPATSPQWTETELSFTASNAYQNPYLEAEAWVDFIHEDGEILRRPMFWDGEATFKVRFASTRDAGRWFWRSFAVNRDPGLRGLSGEFVSAPPPSGDSPFLRHGFWQIPPGGRNLLHADGRARLICADTAWALPWRATPDQARIYAEDRKRKGFNATLLMTVQPDREAVGPRSRTEDGGFDVGFEDLPEATLRKPVPAYFQAFDKLTRILVDHGIAPVYQPVFHGYGWKGMNTAGNALSPEDYARYCRYLVARYGARPAVWLVGGDGPHSDPNVLEQLDAAGREIERWDAYRQPTGIHYAPHAENNTHQDKVWLDFQWCQTGHGGDHMPERVAHMWNSQPAKAVANGEPTYERMGHEDKGAGWWQGHEAWLNLTAGGTMGLAYGAASLWQWKLHPDEPGHQIWCSSKGAGWREALDFEGGRYPGIAARIFDSLPFDGMQPNWHYTLGKRGLAVPGKLFVLYLPDGSGTTVTSDQVPRKYRVFDPATGEQTDSGQLGPGSWQPIDPKGAGQPRVVVFH